MQDEPRGEPPPEERRPGILAAVVGVGLVFVVAAFGAWLLGLHCSEAINASGLHRSLVR